MNGNDLEDTVSSQPDSGDLEDTQPSEINDKEPDTYIRVTKPNETEYITIPAGGKTGWKRLFSYIIPGFLLIIALGALGGYQVGIQDRVTKAEEQAILDATLQFELGLRDMEEGRFEIARQRFEFVILSDPNFPGAAEQLTFAMLSIGTTATLTPIPTPTVTPTLDIREQQELYEIALSYYQESDWDLLLNTLDSLRRADPNYNAVQIDGFYFVAFRNRGMKRILVESNLEGGIFDINRAEQFGLIDVRADGARKWAEWYITGASFWEVNWKEAVFYFNLVAQVAPNLMDLSFRTAAERLQIARQRYGEFLIEQGNTFRANLQWCDSSDAYSEAINFVEFDLETSKSAASSADECLRKPRTPTPSP